MSAFRRIPAGGDSPAKETNDVEPRKELGGRLMARLSRRIGAEVEVVGMRPESMLVALRSSRVPSLRRAYSNGYSHSVCEEAWQATPDGSVSAEAVSPPLGATDSLVEAYRVLSANGASVDRRCGAHVHVDCVNRDGEQMTTENVRHLMRAWFTFDLYRLVAPSRRQGYSKDLHREEYSLRELFRRLDDCNSVGEIADRLTSGKYSGLNLRSFPRHNTVEFRLHQGTLSAKKMVNWTRLLTAFVDAAQEGRPLPGENEPRGIVAMLDWCAPRDLRATENGVIESTGYAVGPVRRAAHRGGQTARSQVFNRCQEYTANRGMAPEALKGDNAAWLVNDLVLSLQLAGIALPETLLAAKKRVRQLMSQWRAERRRDAEAATAAQASTIAPFTVEDYRWFLGRAESLHGHREAIPEGHPIVNRASTDARPSVAEDSAALVSTENAAEFAA